jgi:hypothetical protein
MRFIRHSEFVIQSFPPGSHFCSADAGVLHGGLGRGGARGATRRPGLRHEKSPLAGGQEASGITCMSSPGELLLEASRYGLRAAATARDNDIKSWGLGKLQVAAYLRRGPRPFRTGSLPKILRAASVRGGTREAARNGLLTAPRSRLPVQARREAGVQGPGFPEKR